MKKRMLTALIALAVFLPPSGVTGIQSACAASWTELVCRTGDSIPAGIRGIWGGSASDVFFVGDAGHVFFFDGQSCTTMLDNSFADVATLYGVWGSSANDVFAVGGNHGQILHFNGSGWSVMRSTAEPQNLYGVWGYSPADVFAVGDAGVILRYDGTRWSEMESGTSWPLYAVWGTSDDNIYAAGYAGTILHYDGVSWTAASLGSLSFGAVFYDIWGSSGTDIYVVGNSGLNMHQATGIVYRYNGSDWSQQFLDFSPGGLYEDGALRGVWGSAADNVFAVGGDSFGGGIIHYDGVRWTEVNSGIRSNLFDIWGSSDRDIYAAGTGYRIFRSGGSSDTTTSSSSTTTALTSTTSTAIDDTCPLELLYGSDAVETELLRSFRDGVLGCTPECREVIRLYYQWSQALARVMEEDEKFTREIKAMIDDALPMIEAVSR